MGALELEKPSCIISSLFLFLNSNSCFLYWTRFEVVLSFAFTSFLEIKTRVIIFFAKLFHI